MNRKLMKLDDILQFVRNGLSIKQSKSEGGLPITRIETISKAEINPKKVGYAGLEKIQCKGWLLQQGDILFSHINSIEHLGKCAIYEGFPNELVHGMNLLCLRTNCEIAYPRFLLHYLRSPKFRVPLESIINPSVNQASVSISNLREIEIPLPPLAEQKRIAAILDEADNLRRKRREAIAKLDMLLQSVFLEMFGDPVINSMGWERGTLGDVIHSAKDGPHVSPTYVQQGIPFLSTRHVRVGQIVWEDMKYISQEDAIIHWKKCKPTRGDILYTKGGTTGIAKVVDFDTEIAVWVHIALLKTNHSVVSPIWLENMLNSNFCYEQSQRFTHGIANRDLGLKRMVNIQMYLPPFRLQEEFASRVTEINIVREQSEISLKELENLFAMLQFQAFSNSSLGTTAEKMPTQPCLTLDF